jgi:hypothetical protein
MQPHQHPSDASQGFEARFLTPPAAALARARVDQPGLSAESLFAA